MRTFKPKWEKSFVVVNKEERTGMVCYCFTVAQNGSEEKCEPESHQATQIENLPGNKNQQHPAENKITKTSNTEEEYTSLVSSIKQAKKIFEENVFDHKLIVFEGTFSNMHIRARILQKQKVVPDACCMRCSKSNLNKEQCADIMKTISHPFIQNPIHIKLTPTAVLSINTIFQKSIKEIIESRDNLRQGNDTDARYICVCLTDAVTYLHEQLIVHRDICPQNVFINDNGEVILGNFEQSTYVEELGVYTQGQCGSLGYQSPEVVAQLGYNHTVDYWGIGCIAYEFLFGIMPYVDADVSRMLSKTVLNPDFAITRLGGRFHRQPKPVQEAFRDGFLNRYPHKRIGFKLHEVKQLRWFQPFRWDMVRNKEYESPLKKFISGCVNTNTESNPDIDVEKGGNSQHKWKSITPRSPRWQPSNRSFSQMKEATREEVKHHSLKDCNPNAIRTSSPEMYEASKRKKQNFHEREQRKLFFNTEENKMDSQPSREQKKIDILPFINKMLHKDNQQNASNPESYSYSSVLQGNQAGRDYQSPNRFRQQDQGSHKPYLLPIHQASSEGNQQHPRQAQLQTPPYQDFPQFNTKSQMIPSLMSLPEQNPQLLNKRGAIKQGSPGKTYLKYSDTENQALSNELQQFNCKNQTIPSLMSLPEQSPPFAMKNGSPKQLAPGKTILHCSEAENQIPFNENPRQSTSQQRNASPQVSDNAAKSNNADTTGDAKFKEFVALLEGQHIDMSHKLGKMPVNNSKEVQL